MRTVYFESTAFGDVLVDDNGDLVNVIFEAEGGIPSVDTRTDLDAIVNPALGDAYLVQDENAIYVWDEYENEDYELVQDWRILQADSIIKLDLDEELPWLEENGDTAGSLLIRPQDDEDESDMQTDPGLTTEGYSGLLYYSPDVNGPGGYEPNRTSTGQLYYARKESRNLLVHDKWNVEIWGSVEDDYVFNGLHSLAVTIGRPGYEGYSTLYGEIDRVNNLLRFGRVSGETQTMDYTGLESVALPSPPAGSQFYIWMFRANDIITLYASVTPPVGDPYEAEVTHLVDSFTDSWMEPAEGLYPGFGSQWGEASYGHRFTGFYFSVKDAWRELVLKMKSAEESQYSPEVELILADTRTGWLLGGEGGTPFSLTVNDLTPIDTISIEGEMVTHEYNAGTDAVTIQIATPTPEDLGLPEVDWSELPGFLAKRTFVPLATNTGGGITQPVLEDDPEVAGPRYLCSYMHDTRGFTVFRGYFIAAAAGSGLIGTLEDEYCPPHTVRMAGVREDGTLFAVRVDPNGEVHSYGHQTGNNHLDGAMFYQGEGPPQVIGQDDFIPAPDNPYRITRGTNDEVILVGCGIFLEERELDTTQIVLSDFPDLPGDYTSWMFSDPPVATYVVLDGPQEGQNGAATIVEDGSGMVTVSIPAGLDGNVRVCFQDTVWYPTYAT